MSNGYFSIPRSLTQDPLWQELPLSYQHVFFVIVELACFKPRKFDDHGKILDLLPGQVCISERDLLKKCSKEISYNDVHRAIVKLKKYDFVKQEVKHRKNVLTITHKDTYDLINRSSEAEIDANLKQTRSKLEAQTNNVKTQEPKNQFIKETSNVNVEEKVVALVLPSAVSDSFAEKSLVVESSFLLEKEKEEKKELWKECFERKWTVKEEDIENWHRIYGYEKVKNAFALRKRTTKRVFNDAKWIQTALSKDFYGSEIRDRENFQIATRIKKDLSWSSLTVTEQYCRDEDNGNDYVYKCFEPDAFDSMLIKVFSLKMEREREEIQG